MSLIRKIRSISNSSPVLKLIDTKKRKQKKRKYKRIKTQHYEVQDIILLCTHVRISPSWYPNNRRPKLISKRFSLPLPILSSKFERDRADTIHSRHSVTESIITTETDIFPRWGSGPRPGKGYRGERKIVGRVVGRLRGHCDRKIDRAANIYWCT